VSDVVSVDNVILEHYRKEAEERGLDPASTMFDQTTRSLEADAILRCVEHVLRGRDGTPKLLEVGCGNGYQLQQTRARFPSVGLTGIDYTPEMVELAVKRGVVGCDVRREDVQQLTFTSSSFNIAVSQRCIINVRSASGQTQALRELHRVLQPGGHLILIECFMDGWTNLNRARAELGLAEIPIPPTNVWFEPDRFLSTVEGLFDVVSPADLAASGLPARNFLSTHYFISRVLYPSVTKREVLYNTEFVKFFRFLPPQGDYSPIQLYLLRKRA
jgi:SAM-dependent methyltransferase